MFGDSHCLAHLQHKYYMSVISPYQRVSVAASKHGLCHLLRNWKWNWTLSYHQWTLIWPEVPEILVESMFTDLASRSGTSAHFSNYVGRKVIDDTNEDGRACFEHLCYREAEMIDLQKQPAFQSPWVSGFWSMFASSLMKSKPNLVTNEQVIDDQLPRVRIIDDNFHHFANDWELSDRVR